MLGINAIDTVCIHKHSQFTYHDRSLRIDQALATNLSSQPQVCHHPPCADSRKKQATSLKTVPKWRKYDPQSSGCRFRQHEYKNLIIVLPWNGYEDPLRKEILQVHAVSHIFMGQGVVCLLLVDETISDRSRKKRRYDSVRVGSVHDDLLVAPFDEHIIHEKHSNHNCKGQRHQDCIKFRSKRIVVCLEHCSWIQALRTRRTCEKDTSTAVTLSVAAFWPHYLPLNTDSVRVSC